MSKKSIFQYFIAVALSATMICACAMSPEDKGEHYAKAMVSAYKNGKTEKIEKISEKVSDYASDLSLSDKAKFYKAFYGTLAKEGYNEVDSQVKEGLNALEDLFN